MGILGRISAVVLVLAMGALGGGCGGVAANDVDVTDTTDHALSVPYSATDLGAGNVKFSVTLPSGQRYVEVFSRKNGVQNLAQNITASGVANTDGTTTYSYVKSGYQTGNLIEYRFYSYIGPGVFTPGPASSVWASFTYGPAPTFQTSAGTFVLGPQQDSLGRTFSYQVVTSTGTTGVTPYSTGWYLTKASPTNAEVSANYAQIDLVGTYVKRASSAVHDPVTAYDTYTIDAVHGPNYLGIFVTPDTQQYPGQRVDQTYATGGRFITIPTFIGPQSLYTDATVTFAYLIKQKTWTGE